MTTPVGAERTTYSKRRTTIASDGKLIVLREDF